VLRVLAFAAGPAFLILAGCGGGASANTSGGAFTIAPGRAALDTNCTGCNTMSAEGRLVEQFKATLANGEPASVTWSVTDVNGGNVPAPGSITASGQYTPPSYLLGEDSVPVKIWATNGGYTASVEVVVTPGFLQPISPENLALGPNSSTSITAVLAQTEGSTAINFALASSASGSGVGLGALSPANCVRGKLTATTCTVTYTAPPTIAGASATYIVASVGSSASRTFAEILLNGAGINSSPLSHQAQQLAGPVLLGSSGGNGQDFDLYKSTISDCCGGTLGSLLRGSDNNQYLLSNNHVLARSDQASMGEPILQPGLIDNNCSPNAPGVTPVATLSGFVPFRSASTNVDAAIALVAAGAVDPAGSILELGARQPDGTLAAAAPGISSSNGKGEAAALSLKVAKSGRTTGLTCGGISALDLDVTVDYFLDCAETRPYLSKTFTHQLAVSGNQFSDAGDSGSLLVDAANAEPVGLYFAGGIDASGVSQGVANPAPEVLGELNAQVGGGTTYTFAGSADHAVSCLNYGDSTVAAAQGQPLSDAELARGQQALAQARMIVNPAAGILGVATGKSSDRPGEAAVLVYTDENMPVAVPPTIDGVRTEAIPTTAHAVAFGSAPQTAFEIAAPALPSAVLAPAMALKNQLAAAFMKQIPAFFAIGVGQSLDNPREAALVIYVDRKHIPAQLPAMVNGLRTRYVIMDRLHVTRSYAAPVQPARQCSPHKSARSL